MLSVKSCFKKTLKSPLLFLYCLLLPYNIINVTMKKDHILIISKKFYHITEQVFITYLTCRTAVETMTITIR